MLSDQHIGELVNKYSIKYDLRPDIVACIVLQESKGNPFACRWEEGFYNLKLRGKSRSGLSGFVPPPGTTPSLVDEVLWRSHSFGLMQVLGDTARWCGKLTSPFLQVLHDPEVGMDIGCKILSHYLSKAKEDYKTALKLYNGSWAYAEEIFERIERGEHKRFFIGNE